MIFTGGGGGGGGKEPPPPPPPPRIDPPSRENPEKTFIYEKTALRQQSLLN